MATLHFPHCDQRILHAPGECRYCDGHPDWQELREAWGIAFTGHLPGVVSAAGKTIMGRPVATERSYTVTAPTGSIACALPCPADFNRPPTGESPGPPALGRERRHHPGAGERTAASRMMYGCRRPPRGWVCSQTVGHDGPCAASRLADAIAQARRQPGFMERLRANLAKHSALLDRLR